LLRWLALVHQFNQVLRGWANYFSYGTITPAYRIVHQHACRRVRRWLRTPLPETNVSTSG
jgi:hypothetical protein